MNNIKQLADQLCGILKANYYKNGSTLDYNFVTEEGNRYYKIIMVNNQRGVHAFVDKIMVTYTRPSHGRALPKVFASTL
jgi:hypothetical protein